jgi:predicted DNA-binding transcriptional regulator AlpA
MKRQQPPTPDVADPEGLMSIREYARMLDVTATTARTWLCRGDARVPPAIRCGRNFVRFRRRDVLAIIERMASGELQATPSRPEGR